MKTSVAVSVSGVDDVMQLILMKEFGEKQLEDVATGLGNSHVQAGGPVCILLQLDAYLTSF